MSKDGHVHESVPDEVKRMFATICFFDGVERGREFLNAWNEADQESKTRYLELLRRMNPR